MLLLLFLCSAGINSHAQDLHIVRNINDNGPGSLREAINTAASGDEIRIWANGVVMLDSMIIINKDLIIEGPMPIHFTLNGDNLPNDEPLIWVPTTGGNGVNIQGITFERVSNLGAGNIGALDVTGGTVELNRCQFKNSAAEWGGGIAVGPAAAVTTNECSFFNCEGELGGGVYVRGTYNARNCAFHFNNAQDDGAAVYSDTGSVSLVHCTITQNDAGLAGGGVANVAGSMTLRNCIIADNTSSTAGASNLYNDLGSWSSTGGNLIKELNTSIPFLSPLGSDLLSTTLNPGLRTSIMTDGRGLTYFPITDPTSDAIDRGVNVLFLEHDLRDGFRKMPGPSNMQPTPSDAGAIEYTQLIVTNTSGSPATSAAAVGSLGWAIYQLNQIAEPMLIAFDLPGPNYTISPTTDYDILYQCIIDGYTQPNSRVPGAPNLGGASAVPALPIVEISGASSSTDGLNFKGGFNSRLSGVSVYGFQNSAAVLVRDSASGVQIWGNHIGTDVSGTTSYTSLGGVVAIGTSLNTIGGRRTWQRNVVVGQDSAGVALLGGGTTLNSVLGNFIGVNAFGSAALPNNHGVLMTDTAVLNVVGDSLEGVNLIAGNDGIGVFITDTTADLNYIRSNWIGVDHSGLAPMANHIGIKIGVRSNLVSIGGDEFGWANIVSGNDSTGIYIGANTNEVQGNLIGLGADGITPIGNGSDGIYMHNASFCTIGGDDDEEVNFIANNAGNGIKVELSTITGIYGNAIGTDVAFGTGKGNGKHGIMLGPGSSLIGVGSTSSDVGNLIVENDSAGIAILNSNGGHTIVWNVIGTDTSLTMNRGNGGSGIHIVGNSVFSNQIGDSAENGAINVIAYNGGDGITVVNDHGNRFYRNVIFQNDDLGIDLDNDGPTANDWQDADNTPANEGRNFPVITNALACLTGVLVQGTYNGLPNAKIRIEVFGTTYIEPSGYGEGEAFLAAIEDSTDANGNLTWEAFLPGPIPPGALVTTTATNELLGGRNTSEFSEAFSVQANAVAPMASADTSACVGSPLDSIWATDNYGGTLYWFDNPTLNLAIDSGSSTVPSGLVGDYTYYVVEIVGPCVTLVDSVEVNVEPLDDAAFVFGDFCANESGTPSSITTAGGDFDFFVNPGDGATIDGSTGTIDNPSIGATYQVIYTTDDACPNDTVINVTALDYPTVDSVSISDETCEGDSNGSIIITAGGGTSPYFYSIDGGATAQASNTFNGLEPDTYVVGVADVNGCFSGTLADVGVGNANTLIVEPVEPICPGDSAQLLATGSGVIWWLAVADSTDPAPYVAPDTTTWYFVEDLNGVCEYSDSVLVVVNTLEECGFYIFNAFTPDGDGTNDQWEIRGIEDFPDNEVAIFNRWGDPIIDFVGYDNGAVVWDGTSGVGGNALPQGTYFYVVRLNNGEAFEEHSGWVWLGR